MLKEMATTFGQRVLDFYAHIQAPDTAQFDIDVINQILLRNQHGNHLSVRLLEAWEAS